MKKAKSTAQKLSKLLDIEYEGMNTFGEDVRMYLFQESFRLDKSSETA